MSDGITITRWWWVRHAPVTVLGGRIYGQDDPPADCDDATLFATLAQLLPAEAVWVTSQLQRTHQTAQFDPAQPGARRLGGGGAQQVLQDRLLAAFVPGFELDLPGEHVHRCLQIDDSRNGFGLVLHGCPVQGSRCDRLGGSDRESR